MHFSQFYYSLIFKCLYFFEQISTRTALYLDIYTSRIFQATFCPFFMTAGFLKKKNKQQR